MNANTEDAEKLGLELSTKNTIVFNLHINEGFSETIDIEFYVMDSDGRLKFFYMSVQDIQSELLSGVEKYQLVTSSNIGGTVDGVMHSLRYPNGAVKGLMINIYARMETPLNSADKILVRSSQTFNTFAYKVLAYVTDDKNKRWVLIRPQAPPSIKKIPAEMPW